MVDLPVLNCCTPLAGSSLEEEQAGELEAIVCIDRRSNRRIVGAIRILQDEKRPS